MRRRSSIDTGPAELDAALGVYTLFFSVPRRDIVFFKLLIESYEGIASGRSMQRFLDGGDDRALEVVLAVPDFIDAARAVLACLLDATGSVQLPSTPELRKQLRAALAE